VRLSVFDQRRVGAVASACVAHDEHNGVDIHRSRQQFNAGQAPLVEPGLPEPVDAAVAAVRLSATTDQGEPAYKSGLSVICAGKAAKSEPDLSHVTVVSRQIVNRRRQDAGSHRGIAIDGDARKRARCCSAMLRSRASKLADRHLSIAHNLQFLREARAIRDFKHPARTPIGAWDGATAMTAAQLSASDAPLPENVQVVGSGSELKPSRPWRGWLIFCRLCRWPERPVGSNAPRPVRQLLKRIVAACKLGTELFLMPPLALAAHLPFERSSH
jgi:hypothetical protein